MQAYIRLYLDHFNLGEQSLITCEYCGKMGRVDGSGFDVHHLNGRGKGKDCIENLMCLCRDHHDKVNSKELPKESLIEVHNKYLRRWM
jgi:hypothetical protein